MQENRPPFDFVYLTSNQTATDYKILDKTKLCNVIANKIFLDCNDELTNRVEEVEDNYKKRFSFAPVDEHPSRNNQQTYLTFGLAKIFFPQDLTVQVALTRVKLKLVSFWLVGEGQSPDPKVLLDRFLLKWQSDHEKRSLFVSRLEGLAQDRNKTISQLIKSWQSQSEQEISVCKSQDDRKRLTDKLSGEFRSQFRKVQPGETESNRGTWLSLIQQSTPTLVKLLKEDIQEFLSELLHPNNLDFSLTSARNWLEAMVSELNQLQRGLEEKLQNYGNLYQLEDLDKKWRNIQQSIQDIEQKRGLFGLNEKAKNTEFQAQMQNSVQDICKLLKHNVDYVLHLESLIIVKEMVIFVQKLSTQASALNQVLNSLRTQYQKRSEELTQINQDDITGEALFVDEDTNAYYQAFLPDTERRNQFNSVSHQILEKLGTESSLIHFLIQERLLDEILLKENIDTTVEESLSSLNVTANQSVIQRFLQKYPLSDAEKRMKQILREAEPLLPLNLKAPFFQDDLANRFPTIAFQNKNTRDVQQFEDLLKQKLGVPSSGVIKSIQTDSEITIVNEYGAFPLRLVTGLEQMREHYNRQCQLDVNFLHNDYQRAFIDPIPPDARAMEELQDVFYACLAFDILKEDSNGYIYEYFYGFLNRHEYITLSLVWSEALEQLANAHEVTQELKKQRDQVITSIILNKTLFAKEYEPKLRAFIDRVDKLTKEDPNYSQVSVVLGERATLDKPSKDGILHRLWDYLREEASKVENQPQLSGILPNSRNQIESARELQDDQPEVEVIDVAESFEEQVNQSIDLVQELEKLANLREKGILTDKEFVLAKQKLLGQ